MEINKTIKIKIDWADIHSRLYSKLEYFLPETAANDVASRLEYLGYGADCKIYKLFGKSGVLLEYPHAKFRVIPSRLGFFSAVKLLQVE